VSGCRKKIIHYIKNGRLVVFRTFGYLHRIIAKETGYSKEGNALGFNGFFDEEFSWLWIVVIIIIVFILFAEEFD
jgi:hypothetical protein